MDRSQVTVHVVDDEPGVVDSMRCLIESVGLQTKAYGVGRAFLDSLDPRQAGCVVMDVRLPDLSGLELQEELRARNVLLPVILISGRADVAMAVRGMRNGAVDFLEKPLNDQVLLETIEEALRSDDRDRTAQRLRDADLARVALLTERERQVVDMVVAGRANKETARLLAISQKTVELHRAKAMQKLGASHVAEMVSLMLRCRTH